MCKNNIIILSALCLLVFNQIAGQQKIHSHNDYHQNIPFWLAYGCGLDSIEVDVFLKDNDLMVAHHENEIINQSYGIVLENETNMAARNEAVVLSKLHVNPQSIQRQEFLKMTVFEYLIGNTDWSIQY